MGHVRLCYSLWSVIVCVCVYDLLHLYYVAFVLNLLCVICAVLCIYHLMYAFLVSMLLYMHYISVMCYI